MHGTTLCSTFFAFAYLDAASAATGTWPETFFEHSAEPLTTVDVSEDESALLQAGALHLHSKMHDHGDYAPTKDVYGDYYGEEKYGYDSYDNYGKKGNGDGYHGAQYRKGKQGKAKDGYGGYYGEKAYSYESDNYGKKGYGDGYHGPQSGVGKYDYAKDGYGEYYGDNVYSHDSHDSYGKKGYSGDYHGLMEMCMEMCMEILRRKIHDHDSYGNYGKKGYSGGYRGPQYRVGKHDYAKDGNGDDHGAKMHGYDGYDNYAKKGYASDYHGPQYGAGKYDYDQGRSYDGETDYYALLQVTGLKRAAGDVYPDIHDNGVPVQSKDEHDVYYARSNHDGDYYGNSYDYAHSTAKDEYNNHDRPSAYGNGDHGKDGVYRYSQDKKHNRGDDYVESNYGKYKYYSEMDNDAHPKEGEYYGKIKDYAHAKGAEYYGKQEDSAYDKKKQYYGNADNYAYAKAGKHYGKVGDYSYAKGKFHGKVHDKYPKEITQQSYSYSNAEK